MRSHALGWPSLNSPTRLTLLGLCHLQLECMWPVPSASADSLGLLSRPAQPNMIQCQPFL